MEKETYTPERSSLFFPMPPLNTQTFYLSPRSGALPWNVTKFGQDHFNVIDRNKGRGFDHLSQKIYASAEKKRRGGWEVEGDRGCDYITHL